jgi:hypothetical protein
VLLGLRLRLDGGQRGGLDSGRLSLGAPAFAFEAVVLALLCGALVRLA